MHRNEKKRGRQRERERDKEQNNNSLFIVIGADKKRKGLRENDEERQNCGTFLYKRKTYIVLQGGSYFVLVFLLKFI